MTTERLYYDQPYLKEFAAKLTDARRDGAHWRVMLSRTAFYPTSGGQPNDLGTIAGHAVADVVEDGAEVVHIVSSAADLTQLVGRDVKGVIDWQRRLDHMQQHTGQHILSAAVERLLDADTVGFHLGAEYVTIDINTGAFAADDAARVERLANETVMSCRPVVSHWMTEAQAERLPLRKKLARSGDIRIIEITDFDYNGCGGTHVGNTGEVGPIKIRRWEKVRSDTRIEFVCGWRALADYAWKNEAVNALAAGLSVNERELTDAVDRLQNEIVVGRRALRDARERLLGFEAAELAAGAPVAAHGGYSVIARVFSDRSFDEVRWLAGQLTGAPGRIALLGLAGETAQLIFARSEDVRHDMNKLIKDALPLVGGRGGGNPRVAQGGGPQVAGLEEAIERAKEATLGAKG
ncbi:MAG: alanyl-tRNA editing protein [Chloroflexota bacterium]